MKIEFYTGYNERQNRHYRASAEIVSSLPEIGDDYGGGWTVQEVREAWTDCEQPRRDVWNYQIFEITIADDDGEADTTYVAIRTEEDCPC